MKKNKIGKTFFFLIFLSMPFLTDYYLPVKDLIRVPYSYIGYFILLAGIFLMYWTSIIFKKAENAYELKGKSNKLISSGPFSFSRNPMYLGIVLFLVGLAVILGSLTAFIYPIFLFILLNIFVIPFEERKLEKIYSEDYIIYKNRVRRWL